MVGEKKLWGSATEWRGTGALGDRGQGVVPTGTGNFTSTHPPPPQPGFRLNTGIEFGLGVSLSRLGRSRRVFRNPDLKQCGYIRTLPAKNRNRKSKPHHPKGICPASLEFFLWKGAVQMTRPE